jgi:hypothetical protein
MPAGKSHALRVIIPYSPLAALLPGIHLRLLLLTLVNFDVNMAEAMRRDFLERRKK